MKTQKTLADYSLQELDKAHICLPRGNSFKDEIAKEIEKRMDSESKENNDEVQKALDYLITL